MLAVVVVAGHVYCVAAAAVLVVAVGEAQGPVGHPVPHHRGRVVTVMRMVMAGGGGGGCVVMVVSGAAGMAERLRVESWRVLVMRDGRVGREME